MSIEEMILKRDKLRADAVALSALILTESRKNKLDKSKEIKEYKNEIKRLKGIIVCLAKDIKVGSYKDAHNAMAGDKESKDISRQVHWYVYKEVLRINREALDLGD